MINIFEIGEYVFEKVTVTERSTTIKLRNATWKVQV